MDPGGAGEGTSRSQPPSSRLTGFRGLRDLSLGLPLGKVDVKPRKIYVPNLNVRRNKKEYEDIKESDLKREGNKQSRSRGRDPKGRSTINLVQEGSSVFAEGSAARENRRYVSDGGYGGGRGDSGFIPVPKLNLHHDRKVNKEDEELKLRELYRDDFVDDLSLGPDISNGPIQLPFHTTDIPVKKEIKREKKPIEEETIIHGVKIKKEPIDVLTEAESGMPGETEKEEMEDPEMNERTVADFFNGVDFRMLFLQLPDVMPGLPPEPDNIPAKRSTSCQSSLTEEMPTEHQASKKCDLGSLSDGYMGKIQLLKSGKARLVVNDLVVNLSSSLQLGCREDLVSVQLNSANHTGKMMNLGPLEARLLCSPHWESMLPHTGN